MLSAFKVAFPFNGDMKSLERLRDYVPIVDHVYLPCKHEIMSSGRPWIHHDNYEKVVSDIITKMHTIGVGVNMLFNAIHRPNYLFTPAGVDRLLEYLSKFISKGLDMITVADIMIATQIKKHYTQVKLCASVNAIVNSVSKAQMWQYEAGATSICLDKDVNKNLRLLESIKGATSLELNLLVNEPCLPDCPSKIQHMSMIAEPPLPQDKTLNYRNWCVELYREKPWLIYSSGMVTPAALTHYSGLIDTIKIVGRDVSTEINFKTLDHYLSADNRYLIISKPLIGAFNSEYVLEASDIFRTVALCDRKCWTCNYCAAAYGRLNG